MGARLKVLEFLKFSIVSGNLKEDAKTMKTFDECLNICSEYIDRNRCCAGITMTKGLRSRDESKIYEKVNVEYACINQAVVDLKYRLKFDNYDVKI